MRKIADGADARSIIGQRLSLSSRVKRSGTKAEILMGETTTESERVPSVYYIPAALASVVE